MRRFLVLLAALVLTACAGKVDESSGRCLTNAGNSCETQVQFSEYFRLEFSKEGRSISGYVYNPSSRNPTRMLLRVEGLDAAGKIVTVTRTWVPIVPAYGRAFFQVTVADAPAYRIIVESFSWDKGN